MAILVYFFAILIFLTLGARDTWARERFIEVDLSSQRLFAWEGKKKIFQFTVSSGKKRTPTVRGAFRVWAKLKKAKMEGGSKKLGDYYYLPNVPYIMYFYGSYGLHGTYWHNKFGRPMSHGCVNLRTADSKKLFNWAPLGTKVVIH